LLFIHNEMVEELLSMKECIEVQEAAFAAMEDGGAIHRPRIDMYTPTDRTDGYWRWGTMEGWYDGIFAIRMKSDVITWPKTGNGTWTEEKHCIQPGTFCGLIMLFSSKNGEPLAMINDGVLQHMRVGGGAGIGTKWLSREDSHRRSDPPAAHRYVHAVRARRRVLPMEHDGRRQRRLSGHPDEVGCHHLAPRQGR